MSVNEQVEGLIRLMEGEHVGPFNLGNPGEFTMLELAQVDSMIGACNSIFVFQFLLKTIGIHFTSILSHGHLKSYMVEVVQETIDPNAKIEFRPNTEDDPHKRKPDISKAKQLLGWEPSVSLRNGLPLMVSDFRQRLFGDWKEVGAIASVVSNWIQSWLKGHDKRKWEINIRISEISGSSFLHSAYSKNNKGSSWTPTNLNLPQNRTHHSHKSPLNSWRTLTHSWMCIINTLFFLL